MRNIIVVRVYTVAIDNNILPADDYRRRLCGPTNHTVVYTVFHSFDTE